MQEQQAGWQSSIVCVLPWLALQKPVEFMGFRFETFALCDDRSQWRPTPPSFLRLAEAYRGPRGLPLARWTLASCCRSADQVALPASRELDFRQAAQRLLIAMVGNVLPSLEDRGCGSTPDGGYLNAEALEAHVYERHALEQTPRRRSEQLLGLDVRLTLATSDLALEFMPSTVFPTFLAPKADASLLAAMEHAAAASSDLLARVDTALPFLEAALRDGGRFLPGSIALAAACLEKLCNKDKSFKIAKQLGRLIGQFGSIRVDSQEQKRFAAEGDFEATQSGWWLSQAWAYDLFKSRNNVMHPKQKEGMAWRPEEHLLVFRWIFPRLVKLMLALENHYTLSNLDKAEIWLLDPWLNAPVWYREDKEKQEDGKDVIIRQRHALSAIMRGGDWCSLMLLIKESAKEEDLRQIASDARAWTD